jgi:hypothetical protein
MHVRFLRLRQSEDSVTETDSLELFYSGGAIAGISEWEEIVHSLVTYGRHIWIPASFTFDTVKDKRLRDHFRATLRDLVNSGVVSCWKFAATPHSAALPIGQEISRETQIALYELVNEQLLGQHPAIPQPVTKSKDEVERTSKIIDYRHELWNLGLASELGACGIVFGRTRSKIVTASPQYRYDTLNRRYCRKILDQIQLPSLAHLDAEDITQLRSSAAGLRSKLNPLIASKLLEIPPSDRTISLECRDLLTEYLESVSRLANSKKLKAVGFDSGKDAIISSIGLALPVVGIYPIVERLALWLKDRNRHAFMLYMIEMQRRVARGNNRFPSDEDNTRPR